MESMYGTRGVVKVISISLRYMCVCVCVCVVSGEFSLDGKYVMCTVNIIIGISRRRIWSEWHYVI